MYLDSINTLPNQKINRISHQRCSVKGVVRNFTKFIGKYLCEMQKITAYVTELLTKKYS